MIEAHQIMFLNMEADDSGDTLGCAIATYYESHPDRPDDDPIDDETGWGEWVMEKCRDLDARLNQLIQEQSDE